MVFSLLEMGPVLGRADAEPSLEGAAQALLTAEAGFERDPFESLGAGFEQFTRAINAHLLDEAAGAHASFRRKYAGKCP